MSAIHVNDQSFAAEVLKSNGPVLVDFHANWCGPCRMMSPVVDEVAAQIGTRGRIVKANVDDSPTTAAQYGVQSIPAFVLFKDGEVQEQFSGVVSKERLVASFAPHLN